MRRYEYRSSLMDTSRCISLDSAGQLRVQDRAHAQSRWGHCWELPLFTHRARSESELQDHPQGCLSVHIPHARDDQKVCLWFRSRRWNAFISSRFMTEIELVLYCDFHGHSRRQNVFMYGCENKRLPKERFKERIFPAIFSKNDPNKVSAHACRVC